MSDPQLLLVSVIAIGARLFWAAVVWGLPMPRISKEVALLVSLVVVTVHSALSGTNNSEEYLLFLLVLVFFYDKS